MTSRMSGSQPPEDELVEVLAAYLEQADRGEGDAVLAAHPDAGARDP